MRRLLNEVGLVIGMILAPLGMVILFFAVADSVVMDVPPIQKSKLHSLKSGMSTNEVVSILGPPSTQHPNLWQYSHKYLWTMVYIRFTNGVYQSYEIDH